MWLESGRMANSRKIDKDDLIAFNKRYYVPYAISLILDEFNRIREELVSDEEMDTAVNYYLESFSGRSQKKGFSK